MVSTLRWYNSTQPWVQIPSKLCAEWLTPPPPPALCGHCCWFSLSLFFQEDIIECKKVCAKLAFMFDAFKSKQNYRHSQPPISFQTFFLSLSRSFVRSFFLSLSHRRMQKKFLLVICSSLAAINVTLQADIWCQKHELFEAVTTVIKC